MGRERTLRERWMQLALAVVTVLGCVARAPAVDCDDGNKCTVGDTCRNGVCAGTPVQCPDDGNPCTVAFCNPATGLCVTQDKDCNDGNPCTIDGCNSSVGCTHANAADNTTCNDGNDCTTSDKCTAGVCTGTPVTNGTACGGTSGTDPCRAECENGVCNSTVNNGETCDDGLTCTTGDVCVGAKCVGQSTCVGINPCIVADCKETGCAAIDKCPAAISACAQFGACNETTGACLITPINEGQSCDDANSCTVGDRCVAGQCEGTPLGPEQPAAALSAPWLAGLAVALGTFAIFRVQRHRTRS